MKVLSLRRVDGLKLWMAVVVLMTAVAVFADEGHGPCREDAEKLCPGVKPGGGAIRRCLHENKDKLSEACRTKIKERREHRRHRGAAQ